MQFKLRLLKIFLGSVIYSTLEETSLLRQPRCFRGTLLTYPWPYHPIKAGMTGTFFFFFALRLIARHVCFCGGEQSKRGNKTRYMYEEYAGTNVCFPCSPLPRTPCENRTTIGQLDLLQQYRQTAE